MVYRLCAATLLLAAAGAPQKPQFRLRQAAADRGPGPVRAAQKKTGVERALVLLVEFGGPDTFEFIPTGPNRSTWDPIGKPDPSEWTGALGDCSAIVRKYGIAEPTRYTYAGPLHNRIERPRSAADVSGSMAWSEDFEPGYYRSLMAGDGVRYRFRRQDGSEVDQDLAGWSVRNYFRDASRGVQEVEAEVVGWLRLPHSVYWYGADPCPGRRSGSPSMESSGAIPGAGSERSLVIDAIEAARRERPDLNWESFDTNGDGRLDHLLLVCAGLSEEYDAALLTRTEYGEGAVWSSSGSMTPYAVSPSLKVDSYILLPENADLAVMVHELAHSFGADDLYNIASSGEAFTGLWTIMSDSWLGNPRGSGASAFDPWHLDLWGWLEPLVISDPSREYTVTIGQTSAYPAAEGMVRGVRIDLPRASAALPVQPAGASQWWGGQKDAADSLMNLVRPVRLPEGPAALDLKLAYSIEEGWDFLFVQVSSDGGRTWNFLKNAHSTCKTASGWLGGAVGLPEDLCAAGAGGFTGRSAGYPAYVRETFDLSPYAGKDVQIRFRYFTDTAWTEDGPFVGDVAIAGTATVLADHGDAGDENWGYTGGWSRNAGSMTYDHSYYLQWRNTGPDGGFDRVLSRPDNSFGAMPTGLLVWYSNGRYTSNNIRRGLFDPPSFGPKGRLLLVAARPDPYRDPGLTASGFNNEGANLGFRAQLRGAPFSLEPVPPFTTVVSGREVRFEGRPAVSRFRDGQGWLPGLEPVSPGPRETGGDAWITRSWNTGVALPARAPYPVKGPGYRAGTEIWFNCTASQASGTLSCESRGQKLSDSRDGGSGNPADGNVQYGWNVEIVSQSAGSAVLRIWNELAGAGR